MKLVSFRTLSGAAAARARFGVVTPDGKSVVDLTPELACKDMRSFLEGGKQMLEKARTLLASGRL